MENIPTVGP
jgi:hypothetical protein